jgi:hypothetical protein
MSISSPGGIVAPSAGSASSSSSSTSGAGQVRAIVGGVPLLSRETAGSSPSTSDQVMRLINIRGF